MHLYELARVQRGDVCMGAIINTNTDPFGGAVVSLWLSLQLSPHLSSAVLSDFPTILAFACLFA